MRRRAFLFGGSFVFLAGFLRPETFPLRDASFEEIGNSVLLTIEIPALFPNWDKEGRASIDSGFATTLLFELAVRRRGSNEVIATRRRVVKIQYDFWTKKYLVTTSDEGRGSARRFYRTRHAAIEGATKLRRMRIARASELARGADGPFYYVSIVAQRNPLGAPIERGKAAGAGRAQGRDVRWFSRLVDFLSGGRPVAEQIVRVRTTPFYLVPR